MCQKKSYHEGGYTKNILQTMAFSLLEQATEEWNSFGVI